MMRWHLRQFIRLLFVTFWIAWSGCSGQKPQPAPASPVPSGGTTVMPGSFYTSYYSTQKARALGEIYDKNLEHLLTQLTQSSIGKLQFANAIVSFSVGFFTHAASQPPDERYLEALIGMPDILDEEKDFSTLVGQLFSQYGHDVLSTLAQDEAIARDSKIAGYGIHFSWRGLAKTPSGPHLTMREAVLYFAKDQATQFLSQQLSQDDLLSRATLFSRRGEHPAEQVQYLLARQHPHPPSPLQQENREASLLPAPAEQEPAREPPAALSPAMEVTNATPPLPTPSEQEPIQTPPVAAAPALEVTSTPPPLLESRVLTRRKKAHFSKHKRWRKRSIRQPASTMTSVAPPSVVLPNKWEESQPSSILPR